MTQHLAIDITRDALLMTIIISAPMLGIGLVVGLFISVIQTTTSIQEQTLTFVPKLLAILVAVSVFGPWMIRMMCEYMVLLLDRMATITP